MGTARFAARVVVLGVLLLVGCQAAAVASGTWTGTMSSPNQLKVRFVIEDQNGKLSGRTYFEDESTKEFYPEAENTGTRDDVSASWTTETDVVVKGKFEGNKFTGTITFPADGEQASHEVGLTLTR